MEELKENISHMKSSLDTSAISGKLNSLKKLVDHSFSIDKDWEDFRLHFEQVHQDFFKLLKDRCPELSNSELKLCALVKLNLNMKEMSAILGISPESVKTARYRLRKKLQLSHEESLSDFIMDINQKATASTL
jgi:DNA-binding CsgD family transcriptional regulator